MAGRDCPDADASGCVAGASGSECDGPRREQHSLSCTDAEWEQIEAQAAVARYESVSRFLIDCALEVDGHPLALSEDKQQQIVDDVSALTKAVLQPFPDTGVTLSEAITFLYRDHLARQGPNSESTL